MKREQAVKGVEEARHQSGEEFGGGEQLLAFAHETARVEGLTLVAARQPDKQAQDLDNLIRRFKLG